MRVFFDQKAMSPPRQPITIQELELDVRNSSIKEGSGIGGLSEVANKIVFASLAVLVFGFIIFIKTFSIVVLVGMILFAIAAFSFARYISFRPPGFVEDVWEDIMCAGQAGWRLHRGIYRPKVEPIKAFFPSQNKPSSK